MQSCGATKSGIAETFLPFGSFAGADRDPAGLPSPRASAASPPFECHTPSALRIVGFPVAAIPKLHGAATILALRNGAFEIAIIERVIFHLHREALVARIERRPLRDRPGFEDAVELQPEIIMQACRIMLLNHEAPLLRRLNRRIAAGLRGLFEIALFSIGGEVSQRHDQIPRT